MKKKESFPTIKDEELIRKAEILLDSSTQKALRGLAYLRVLRSRIAKVQGSHCGKCGCQLSEETRKAVYCVLESIFGYAETGESYWRLSGNEV